MRALMKDSHVGAFILDFIKEQGERKARGKMFMRYFCLWNLKVWRFYLCQGFEAHCHVKV